MKYSKQTVENYAIGNVCTVRFLPKSHSEPKHCGWLVHNDPKSFHSDAMVKYALLCLDGRFIGFNLSVVDEIRLANGYVVFARDAKAEDEWMN